MRTPLQSVGASVNNNDEATAAAAVATAALISGGAPSASSLAAAATSTGQNAAASASAASFGRGAGGGATPAPTSLLPSASAQQQHSLLAPTAPAAYAALGMMPLILRPSAVTGATATAAGGGSHNQSYGSSLGANAYARRQSSAGAGVLSAVGGAFGSTLAAPQSPSAAGGRYSRSPSSVPPPPVLATSPRAAAAVASQQLALTQPSAAALRQAQLQQNAAEDSSSARQRSGRGGGAPLPNNNTQPQRLSAAERMITVTSAAGKGTAVVAALSAPATPAAGFIPTAGRIGQQQQQQQQTNAATVIIPMAPKEPRPLPPLTAAALLEEARRGDDLLAMLTTRLGGLLRHEESYHYKYSRALRIQCLWRRVRAKKEADRRRRLRDLRAAQSAKAQHKASTTITNFFRSIIAAKKERARRAEEAYLRATADDRAATVLQKYVRRWNAVRTVGRARERFQRRVRHITLLQRLWREKRAQLHVAAQRIAKGHELAAALDRERRHAAAAKIQATMRCHWALIAEKKRIGDFKGALAMDKRKLRDWAARLIQRHVRGFFARRVHGQRVRDVLQVCRNKSRAARRRAAQTKIAALWRGYAVRISKTFGPIAAMARAAAERRRQALLAACAVKIQTRVRMCIAARVLAERRSARSEALLEERRAWHKSERRW